MPPYIYNYNTNNQHIYLLTKVSDISYKPFQNMMFQLGSQGFQPLARTYLTTLVLNLKYYPPRFLNKQNNNI